MTNSDDSGRLLVDTVEPSATLPPVEPGPLATLTILLHPDTSRVGERARLYRLGAGGVLGISRLEPEFLAPGDMAPKGAPLADPAVSRRPLWLQPEGGGVVVDPRDAGSRVVVAGDELTAPRRLDARTLDRGVVIELARRVVLLLHRSDPRLPRHERADRTTLVGDNDTIERIRSEIAAVADTDVPVLLRGETGTGKELLARAIHAASARAGRPFVSVNMAAVPPTTAASALFGHSRGAFTGALRDHEGFFQQAHGGTLFLDEVGDTPPDIQVMLLRVLETGEVQRLGAQRCETVDVRLIAATDGDLDAATREGTFRAPLLHRLSAYELVAPPLRERRDDVARLLLHFLRLELRAVGEERRLDPPEPGARPWLSAALVARLVEHDWPGNVRQLHNFVRQLVITNRGAAQADGHELLARLGRPEGAGALTGTSSGHGAAAGARSPVPPDGAGAEAPRSHRPPSEITAAELTAVLRQHRWRLGATARALGISRTSLYALIERSETIRKARDIGRDELLACRQACRGDVDRMAEALQVSPRGLQLRLRELGLVDDGA
jgi:DNA-binding NtrC family response regulator